MLFGVLTGDHVILALFFFMLGGTCLVLSRRMFPPEPWHRERERLIRSCNQAVRNEEEALREVERLSEQNHRLMTDERYYRQMKYPAAIEAATTDARRFRINTEA